MNLFGIFTSDRNLVRWPIKSRKVLVQVPVHFHFRLRISSVVTAPSSRPVGTSKTIITQENPGAPQITIPPKIASIRQPTSKSMRNTKALTSQIATIFPSGTRLSSMDSRGLGSPPDPVMSLRLRRRKRRRIQSKETRRNIKLVKNSSYRN